MSLPYSVILHLLTKANKSSSKEVVFKKITDLLFEEGVVTQNELDMLTERWEAFVEAVRKGAESESVEAVYKKLAPNFPEFTSTKLFNN